ncbi:MAG: ABC transporter substrate-binding protein [Aliidongia sp.]
MAGRGARPRCETRLGPERRQQQGALEFLNARSLDFGSTAGAAALLGRANGNPIKTVYVYSKPEWTALVTRADTPINSVADLKDKRIAVTRGTDPHIFLLRALAGAGLTEHDVKIVPLQHADGRLALDRGDVDAWSGLDPLHGPGRAGEPMTACSSAIPISTPMAC